MWQLRSGLRASRRLAALSLVKRLAGSLLCVVLTIACDYAQASMPAIERVSQVCVLDGFLIGSPTGYVRLKYVDKVDWSKFEGKTVRYKWRLGPGFDILLVPPSVVGPCDPALVAAALPRALAQRAENEFVLKKEHQKSLVDIKRAIELAPQNCEFVASYVFMLEQLGRRKEAEVESARATGMPTCSRLLYQQKQRLLRQGTVLHLD